MILQLLACFLLWTVALMVVFEVYSWILHRMAFLPRTLLLLFGYLLYCVIAGVTFGLPVFGFELILGQGTLQMFNEPQIQSGALQMFNEPQIQIGIGFIVTVYGGPGIAFWFFQRRHMASLKKLGFFLPIQRP